MPPCSVQRGTLKPGDSVVAGDVGDGSCARAVSNPQGDHAEQAAYPSDPVEILGLSTPFPRAGDEFRVFEDERDARKLAEERALRARLAGAGDEEPYERSTTCSTASKRASRPSSNLVVKADVQGSIEALRDAFEKMDQCEVKIQHRALLPWAA